MNPFKETGSLQSADQFEGRFIFQKRPTAFRGSYAHGGRDRAGTLVRKRSGSRRRFQLVGSAARSEEAEPNSNHPQTDAPEFHDRGR
jgi:hypothetical protein